jgi:hypothetical protein
MSSAADLDEAATAENMCANCGIAGVDDIKLEECTDCDLVKYCSDNCREEHREQHGEECKNRKAELHKRKLFTQPDKTHLDECPLCFLPMPLDDAKATFMSCCGKWICTGCAYAHIVINLHDEVKTATCAFCRALTSDKEEFKKRERERIEANDPAALCFMGTSGFQAQDYDKAVEYWAKAAELGDAEAHFKLGLLYTGGEGDEKDDDKGVYHLEKAAIGGHPQARHILGLHEEASEDGRLDRAVKHYIIAANLGYGGSMKKLWKYYSDGNITKEDLDATLRTHQAAIDAMKSKERDAADAIFRRNTASCFLNAISDRF